MGPPSSHGVHCCAGSVRNSNCTARPVGLFRLGRIAELNRGIRSQAGGTTREQSVSRA